MLHPGEQAVQHRAGVTAQGRGSAGVGARVPPVAAAFLSEQRLVVIAAADDTGAMWTSLLTGPPGFTTAIDDRTVAVDRLPTPGDPLAGRFDTEHDIGMLVIDLANRKRMRLNGRARREDGRLVVRTDQVYSNCPKYIQARSPAGEAPPVPQTITVTGELTADQRQWITSTDTFFVGTHATSVGADASHRGGNPGFITAPNSHRLTWPDYVGNNMYMTLGNLALQPQCGLLFPNWDDGRLLHLTGHARTDWNPNRKATVPGAQRLIDFDIEQVVERTGCLTHHWSHHWSLHSYFRFNPPTR